MQLLRAIASIALSLRAASAAAIADASIADASIVERQTIEEAAVDARRILANEDEGVLLSVYQDDVAPFDSIVGAPIGIMVRPPQLPPLSSLRPRVGDGTHVIRQIDSEMRNPLRVDY